ncbi:MAG: NYN domain-containing protein [Candidatus Baltobacteraceae bacterium]
MLFLGAVTIRSNVYVDGFNLYYGAVKNTSYKWLDIAELCRQVLPSITINRIRYFTALVKANPADPQITQRQQFYIRALETIPNLTVHYGHFLQSVVPMMLASPPAAGSPIVRVRKMEEKGSDVNIATYMLTDAFRNDCDQLIVITNDSDLAEPIRIINKELKIPVGVLNPHTQDTADRRHRLSGRAGSPPKATPSVELRKYARFVREIRSEGPRSHVALSQFPPQLHDAQGRILKKPALW